MSEVEVSGAGSPDVSAAAPVATSAPESSGNQSVNSVDTSGAASAAPVVPPSYQPNYKYKFAGKEHEIDEVFRSAIKDQETEKKVKDIFQRSMAFDDAKTKWEDKVKTHYEPTVQQFQQLDRDVKRVMSYRNAGDFDNFFHELKIPAEAVIDWARQQVELAENPQQKMLHDQVLQERRARANMEDQYNQQSSQMNVVQTREREFELHLVMAQPGVTEVAQKLEGMMGEGSFRQLVIDEGIRALSLYGRDISAQDAVNLVVQRFGKLAGGSMQGAVIPAEIPQTLPQAGAGARPPVIPNINGKGTSPVKKVPKSIDDIRKIHAEKFGSS